LVISAATGWGQILTFDFDGLRGGEATAMSNANNANLFSSTITRGAGLTATDGDGWNRFNATSWATTSIGNAVSGNKYVEFTITPRAGFRFTVSSITVQWRCSGTGGTQIALRSSVDNYSSNLEGVKSVSDSISATTLSWISGFSGSSSSAVTYRLYSYVQNATGQGGPGGGSGNDIVVNGTVIGIPAAPTITSITPGNRQLSVAFTAGSDGGSSIMHYEYSTDGGTSWWRYTSGTTSPLLITALSTGGSTALANGTSYNVQIRAVSMVGTGTATASTAATPRTTPGAPMIMSVTPGNGQLTVSFGAPSSDGGSPITDYEYSIDGGASFMPRLSTSTTFVIGSLMNGSSYNVQVRAVNAAGRGTATSSWAGTPRTTPNAPSINYVTPGNKQLSVGFMAGSDGGSAITNYQYSTDGGTSWRTHTTTFSPILITTLSTDGTTALANGTSYNVQLRAVNAAGSGTATSSTAATPRTTPGAPTSLALTPGNGQLTASFFAPSDGGSPITHYEYSINGGSSFTSILSTSTTIVIGSLMNGSSYNVQVRAVNAVGSGTATASVAGTPTAPVPTIQTSGSLSAVNSTYGVPSSATSFSLSGIFMTEGVTVTPPAGFEVSTASDFSSNVGTVASPLVVGAAGTISSTTVYVRLAASTAAGSYSGNIQLTSTGATGVNVATVSSTVSKVTPTITSAPTAAAITFGQSLASSSLSGGTGSVPGSFAFTSTSATPSGAGSYSTGITFTPTDTTNYNNASGAVTVTVNKANPTIDSAPTASDINSGQALGASTLSGGSATGVGGASLDGSFDFTYPSTVPPAGTANYSVIFTPSGAGASNYLSVMVNVSVTVNNTTTPAEDYLSSFGLTGADAALSADPDHDGLTNATEFAFGTDPTDGSSRPIQVVGDKLLFFKRAGGATYVIKHTTDLATSWTVWNTPPTLSNPQPSGRLAEYLQYEIIMDTSIDRDFYKVEATIP
jgi:hypothetical protein